MNRIALGLMAEARRTGSFGDDPAALSARAAALGEQFGDDTTPLGPVSVKAKLRRDGRLELRVAYADGTHEQAELRPDGYLLGSSKGHRVERRSMAAADLEPWEREEEERRKLAREAARGKPKFRGRRYLRTVLPPPQPASAERILAADLYDDGLIVEFTYDNDVPEERIESFISPRPPMRIEDDLGTDYYEGERASYGGGPASRAEFSFAPAVPPTARALRITTDSGTVELEL